MTQFRYLRRAVLAATVFATAFAFVVASAQAERYADRPQYLIELTDDLYDHDCFWGGPRGSEYAKLAPGDVSPNQIPNLYPDVQATYFFARFFLPAGARLSFAGSYPYARYLSYALQPGTAANLLAGDNLTDHEIVPDPGSVNPFDGKSRRDSPNRAYTINLVSGLEPNNPAPNTLYTGNTNPALQVTLVLRHYVPDTGRDGTGDAGLPVLTLTQADNTTLQGAAACTALLSNPQAANPPGYPLATWNGLVAGSSDPANAPAVAPSRWYRFWNAFYSINSLFGPTTVPPDDIGGFASNPDTRYLFTFLSLNYGPVYTFSARMPKFNETFEADTKTLDSAKLRYWSVCTGSAPPSGKGYDCVFDQQVALRDDAYTIVVSRPEDRPTNATEECGYTWLDFGAGEALPGLNPGRAHVGAIYMRFMEPALNFNHSPLQVTEAGTEEQVMGPYFPQGEYTTKAAFEQLPCLSAED
jgi:hypothetical protein